MMNKAWDLIKKSVGPSSIISFKDKINLWKSYAILTCMKTNRFPQWPIVSSSWVHSCKYIPFNSATSSSTMNTFVDIPETCVFLELLNQLYEFDSSILKQKSAIKEFIKIVWSFTDSSDMDRIISIVSRSFKSVGVKNDNIGANLWSILLKETPLHCD